MSSSTTTTTNVNQDATSALRARGVHESTIRELLASADGELILGWCDWWDRQKGVGAGALVAGVRSGERPPAPVKEEDRQREYMRDVLAWITAKMPELCRVDQRLVEATRELWGDDEAARLAASTSPHPKAIVAVLRLHREHGRLTVRRHGAEIRAAAAAWDEAQLRQMEAIAQARREATTEVTT